MMNMCVHVTVHPPVRYGCVSVASHISADCVALCSVFPCRREYNRRVREVVEQSWVEQDV